MVILDNIDIDIDMVILENIYIVIDIRENINTDMNFVENIDIDKGSFAKYCTDKDLAYRTPLPLLVQIPKSPRFAPNLN